MKKKTIIIIGLIALVGVIVVLNLSSQREKSVKVTVEKVKTRDLTAFVSASGEVKPKKNINISALILGRIIKIGIKEGQEVKEGDLLFDLDARPYRAALAEAGNRVAWNSVSSASAARQRAGRAPLGRSPAEDSTGTPGAARRPRGRVRTSGRRPAQARQSRAIRCTHDSRPRGVAGIDAALPGRAA